MSTRRERRQGKRPFPGNDSRGHSTSRKVWVALFELGPVAALGEARFQSDTDSAIELCEKHLAAAHSGEWDKRPLHSLLLKNVDQPVLRILRRYLKRVEYRPGDKVFSQGSGADGMFFLASGRVDVIIDLPGVERKRKVQSLTSGSIFGEMAIIDSKPRSASILLVEPSLCYFMSLENFERLKREQTGIAFLLISNMTTIFADRLRATNAMLAEMEA